MTANAQHYGNEKMSNRKRLDTLMDLHWNTDLPPVDIPVLIAMADGTVWKIQRDHWLKSRKDDPNYTCITTGHRLPINEVLGWRYP